MNLELREQVIVLPPERQPLGDALVSYEIIEAEEPEKGISRRSFLKGAALTSIDTASAIAGKKSMAAAILGFLFSNNVQANEKDRSETINRFIDAIEKSEIKKKEIFGPLFGNAKTNLQENIHTKLVDELPNKFLKQFPEGQWKSNLYTEIANFLDANKGLVYDLINCSDDIDDAKLKTKISDLYSNINGEKLRGFSLSDKTLDNLKVFNSDLSGCSIENVELDNPVIYKADLDASYINNLKINNGNLFEVDLKTAEIKKLNIDGSTLTDVSFRGAEVKENSFITGSILNNCDFRLISKEDLEKIDLKGSTLVNPKFSEDIGDAKSFLESRGAVLVEKTVDTKTIESNIKAKEPKDSNLGREQTLSNITIANDLFALIKEMRLEFDKQVRESKVFDNLHFKDMKARGISIEDKDFSRAILEVCDLSGLLMKNSKARESLFYKCDMDGGDIENADLKRAVIMDSSLNAIGVKGSVDLRNAIILGGSLKIDDIDKLQLKGMVISRETSLPKGISHEDLEAKGAKLVSIYNATSEAMKRLSELVGKSLPESIQKALEKHEKTAAKFSNPGFVFGEAKFG